jgi:hypothetical protein
MAYVQLSCRGLAANVIHGNALTLEVFGAEVTPGKLAFVQHHGEAYLRWVRGLVTSAAEAPRPAPLAGAEQVELVFGDLERAS